MVIHLPEPDLADRAALWRALLPPGTPLEQRDADELAARFRFNPGRIARTVARAISSSALLPPGRRALTAPLLAQAGRDVGAAAMGSLAQRLPLPFSREDLVVPPDVAAELALALVWVKQQRKVLDGWGFAARVPTGRGLTMLFSGPPGTGKTMAAQVMARELGLELYRVDLSRVMNKYIGETEKNLARLFDEAQAASATLFFDEADALFGKRSEVKDAHDRYANVEIGYLLQRMEEYEGVTILASNRKNDLDEAFARRFHFMVEFPKPDEPHRLRIWRGMFPDVAERDADIDFARLAREFEVSGGEIKNVVLAAAYMAAGEGRPVGMAHLKRGLRREFEKSGKVFEERRLKAFTPGG